MVQNVVAGMSLVSKRNLTSVSGEGIVIAGSALWTRLDGQGSATSR